MAYGAIMVEGVWWYGVWCKGNGVIVLFAIGNDVNEWCKTLKLCKILLKTDF